MAFPLLPKAAFYIALVFLSSPAWAQSPGTGRTFLCCEDNQGRPACGDVLPAICYGRAYREVSPSGIVRRYVAAPMSAKEIAELSAQSQSQKEESDRQLVQRRLDQALLGMYSSTADIDENEERTLNALKKELEDMRAREFDLQKRQATLKHESQLYSDGELPDRLKDDLKMVEQDRSMYRSSISAKETEIAAAHERFKQERQRFKELKLQ